MTGTLGQNGFEDVRLMRFEYNLTMARYWNDMYDQDLLDFFFSLFSDSLDRYMGGWEEFAETVLKTPEETAQLGNEALEQMRDGSAIMCPKLLWIARKTRSTT